MLLSEANDEGTPDDQHLQGSAPRSLRARDERSVRDRHPRIPRSRRSRGRHHGRPDRGGVGGGDRQRRRRFRVDRRARHPARTRRMAGLLMTMYGGVHYGTTGRPNANPILALMRDDDMSDPWSTAMAWGFGVCDYLHHVALADVPAEMGYTPAAT